MKRVNGFALLGVVAAALVACGGGQEAQETMVKASAAKSGGDEVVEKGMYRADGLGLVENEREKLVVAELPEPLKQAKARAEAQKKSSGDGRMKIRSASVGTMAAGDCQNLDAIVASNVTVGSRVTLDGMMMGWTGGSCQVEWSLVSKPAGSTATAQYVRGTSEVYQFTADKEGAYTVRVGNRNQLTNTVVTRDIVVVAATGPANTAPTVSVSTVADRSVGQSVTLTATGSDANANPLKYKWLVTNVGPYSNLAPVTYLSDTNTLTFTPDVPGMYTVAVVANDGVTDSAPVYRNVFVKHPTPVRQVFAPNAVVTDVTFAMEQLTTTSTWDLQPRPLDVSINNEALFGYAQFYNGTAQAAVTCPNGSACDSVLGLSKSGVLATESRDPATFARTVYFGPISALTPLASLNPDAVGLYFQGMKGTVAAFFNSFWSNTLTMGLAGDYTLNRIAGTADNGNEVLVTANSTGGYLLQQDFDENFNYVNRWMIAKDGVLTDLQAVDFYKAWALNDALTVVGESPDAASGRLLGFKRTAAGQTTVLDSINVHPFACASAYAVTNTEMVAGVATGCTQRQTNSKAQWAYAADKTGVIWHAGKTYNVNSLLSTRRSDLFVASIGGINEHGFMAGHTRLAKPVTVSGMLNYQTRPVVLKPVAKGAGVVSEVISREVTPAGTMATLKVTKSGVAVEVTINESVTGTATVGRTLRFTGTPKDGFTKVTATTATLV